VAHAKDKGAKDKHVKKKAQKSIKERRAEKKARKGSGGASSRHTILHSPE
jgi:hypothetical protein